MTAKSKPNALLDKALTRLQAGDMAGAESGFRSVLKDDPDHPDALVLLGNLLRETKRPGEAVRMIARGIEAAPKRGRAPDPAWPVLLAMARRDNGDVAGALADVGSVLKLAPHNVDLLVLHGGLLQRLGRHKEAVKDLYAAHGLRPDDAQILNNLGISLRASGRMKDAFKAFHRAVAMQPNFATAAVNASKMLRDGGNIDDAIILLRGVTGGGQGDVTTDIALADVLTLAGRFDEAGQIVENLLKTNPGDAAVMVKRAEQLLETGDQDLAGDLLRRALAVNPDVAGGLALLAELGSGDPAELLGRIDDRLAGDADAIGLRFAAARLCEKLGRYQDAFAHYLAGNARRKAALAALDKGYDRFRAGHRVDELIAAFDRTRCVGRGGSDSELPVFVVGMPRSGTTLTEQILASHPLVAGAGELTEVGAIVGWLRRDHGYPAALPAGALNDSAAGYLSHVTKIGRGARRVVDKLPGNFMHLGLIARLFPKARIIHCRRDPMDTCLSCFAQNFGSDNLDWSCDLDNLAYEYFQYRRIMEHWRQVLPPGMMLEIDYEDTVADLESQARRLVDFTGLPWDETCLRFHESGRGVKTASRAQVKQPVYNSSVGRWKRYGDDVLPLVRALAGYGIAVEV